MKKPSEDLQRAMSETAATMKPSEDKVDRLRIKAIEARDLDFEISSLEEKLEDLKHTRTVMLTEELPLMMDEVKFTSITLEATGNLPAVKLSLKPYYSANISVKWDDEKRAVAFKWLDDHAAGDLIKTTVEVAFSKEERHKALAVVKLLKAKGIDADVNEKVHPATLTAWVKESVEHGEMLPLDVIGATVGRVVKIEDPRKK
jgi:hypothetical protein